MSNDPSSHPSVVSEQDARCILCEVLDQYTPAHADRLVGGKRPVEVLAEAVLRDGHARLATDLSMLDRTLMDIAAGRFQELSLFHETHIAAECIDQARNTKYGQSVADLLQPTLKISQMLVDYGSKIDWESSGIMLKQIKAEFWPQRLTMRERLEEWVQATDRQISP